MASLELGLAGSGEQEMNTKWHKGTIWVMEMSCVLTVLLIIQEHACQTSNRHILLYINYSSKKIFTHQTGSHRIKLEEREWSTLQLAQGQHSRHTGRCWESGQPLSGFSFSGIPILLHTEHNSKSSLCKGWSPERTSASWNWRKLIKQLAKVSESLRWFLQ